MTKEEEEYYEEYFLMFSSKGWKYFIEDCNRAIVDAKNKAFLGDETNFLTVKAETVALARIIGLENRMRAAYKLSKEDDSYNDGADESI